MNLTIKAALAVVRAILARLPRRAVAAIVRQGLALLAQVVEGRTTSLIVHKDEVIAFGYLDTTLAKIEADAPPTP